MARMVLPSSDNETLGEDSGWRQDAGERSPGSAPDTASQWPTTRSGSRLDCASSLGRIGGQRIAQARDLPFSIAPLGTGHDHAGFVTQALDIGVDAILLQLPAAPSRTPAMTSSTRGIAHSHGDSFVLGRPLLLLQTVLQARGQIPQGRAVALEFFQLDSRSVRECRDSVSRSTACSDSGGLPRMTAARNANGPSSHHNSRSPSRTLSMPPPPSFAVPSNESRTKSWMAVSIPETMLGILRRRFRRRNVFEEKSGLAVNQEDVLDAELAPCA